MISLTALMGPTTLVSLVMVAVLVLPERANADKLPFGVTVFGGVSAGGGIYSASTSQGSVEWTSADGGKDCPRRVDRNTIRPSGR